MATATKRVDISKLKAGDVVHDHGARFKVLEAARDSNSHFPKGYWPADSIGPTCVACADSICIEGEIQGYFKPGSNWPLQGRVGSVTYAVEI